jgi:hypothetical protein
LARVASEKLYARSVGLKPVTRVVLFAIWVLVVAIETRLFTQAPSWLSAVAAFFFLLPALFGGVNGPP